MRGRQHHHHHPRHALARPRKRPALARRRWPTRQRSVQPAITSSRRHRRLHLALGVQTVAYGGSQVLHHRAGLRLRHRRRARRRRLGRGRELLHVHQRDAPTTRSRRRLRSRSAARHAHHRRRTATTAMRAWTTERVRTAATATTSPTATPARPLTCTSRRRDRRARHATTPRSPSSTTAARLTPAARSPATPATPAPLRSWSTRSRRATARADACHPAGRRPHRAARHDDARVLRGRGCHNQTNLVPIHLAIGCEGCHSSADPLVVNAIATTTRTAPPAIPRPTSRLHATTVPANCQGAGCHAPATNLVPSTPRSAARAATRVRPARDGSDHGG